MLMIVPETGTRPRAGFFSLVLTSANAHWEEGHQRLLVHLMRVIRLPSAAPNAASMIQSDRSTSVMPYSLRSELGL
jgi:hypothetical protein